jgi:hypothetical protein
MNIQSIGGILKQAINSVEDRFDRALDSKNEKSSKNASKCEIESHMLLEKELFETKKARVIINQ